MKYRIEPLLLSVKELLSEECKYMIPIYQRNYDWENGEIEQFIQDIIDSFLCEKERKKELHYYIGTLVVFPKDDGIYETIDGQQRLTTLSLLASYFRNNKAIDVLSWYKQSAIYFECRELSDKAIDAIFGALEDAPDQDSNEAILKKYRHIKRVLPHMLENKICERDFVDYLFNNVRIIRVCVPKYTDVNHYFEIMNNRGEQLEKHELLKSLLIAKLDGEDTHCLHAVWEACANMEKYVQTGFTKEHREGIFGADWRKFRLKDFCDLKKVMRQNGERVPGLELDKIIWGKAETNKGCAGEDERPERFNSVINFQNFLLHVLRVQTEQDIPLDDKRLIDTFEKELFTGDPVDVADRVRKFTFNLLRCRFLYDQYVIKHELIGGKDRWSLKRFRCKEGAPDYKNTFDDDKESNKHIIMILSAFHVSAPAHVYKHWLSAALLYLFKNGDVDDIDAVKYLTYLESIARAFVFDLFLAPYDPNLNYYTIIYKYMNRCNASGKTMFKSEMMKQYLSYYSIQNNFVFNYLDYLLWKEYKDNDYEINKFEFTPRSSLEHFYPQHPRGENPPTLSIELLHSFGNLCLISHSKNSKLGNLVPASKVAEYYNSKSEIDSVKLHLMINMVKERNGKWDEDSIKQHYKEMKKVLLDDLKRSNRINGDTPPALSEDSQCLTVPGICQSPARQVA